MAQVSDDLRVPMGELMTLREFRARLPTRSNGRRVDLATVYRWANRGIRGVRLRTVKVGGVMYTSAEWAWEFFNRDNPSPPAPTGASAGAAIPGTRPWRTPAEDRRALARARRRLRAMGVLRDQ